MQDVAVWSFEDACQKVAGQVPDDVHSLVEVSNTFDISVSTYSNGNVNEGLTLYDSVTLTGIATVSVTKCDQVTSKANLRSSMSMVVSALRLSLQVSRSQSSQNKA